MFTHVVLFHLKSTAPASAKQQLMDDCRTYLSKIDGLKFFEVGSPAMTPREVVDNSYTVGLLTVFADKAAHDAYQVDPSHKTFIERNKDNWEKVRIFDFV